LQAQGKSEEAANLQHHFDQVWSQADVELTSSRF
jgi:hypothetical protein